MERVDQLVTGGRVPKALTALPAGPTEIWAAVWYCPALKAKAMAQAVRMGFKCGVRIKVLGF